MTERSGKRKRKGGRETNDESEQSGKRERNSERESSGERESCGERERSSGLTPSIHVRSRW
jgi:hypothetical protein